MNFRELLGFLLVFILISVPALYCDRLDNLLKKHWSYCGQSLNVPKPISSSTTPSSTTTEHVNRTSVDGRFDFIVNSRRTCTLDQSSSSSSAAQLETRIVGGHDAERFEFPWQISLRRYSQIMQKWYHSCGGAIIDHRWIITAAHCVLGPKNPELFQIRIGEHNYGLEEGSEINVNISRIIDHVGFNFKTLEPDIALIELVDPIVFGSKSSLRPICFPRVDSLVPKSDRKIEPNTTKPLEPKTCASTGWGKTVFHGEFPDVLQKVCVDLVEIDDCRRRYEQIINVTETMICSGQGGSGTCEGDSGGPLQCVEEFPQSSSLLSMIKNGGKLRPSSSPRWTLYGLTSWAIGCGEDQFPSVATNVATLREWIADQILAKPSKSTTTITTEAVSGKSTTSTPSATTKTGTF